jgi:hypothetical protein
MGSRLSTYGVWVLLAIDAVALLVPSLRRPLAEIGSVALLVYIFALPIVRRGWRGEWNTRWSIIGLLLVPIALHAAPLEPVSYRYVWPWWLGATLVLGIPMALAGFLRPRYGWLSLLLAPIIGHLVVMTANCDFDRGPLARSRALVLDVSSTRRGIGTGYHVRLDPWGERTEPESARVSREVYETLAAGATATVGVRPGALGIPWIAEIAPVRPTPRG